MIPKRIHQTWKTKEIPERFRSACQSWQQHHPDWQYTLWTHDMLADFVRTHYPKIWPLYCRYPEDIQRVDAARLMVLHRYGGIYSDLDIVCLKPFDRFLNNRAVMAPTQPLGLSNDLMMTVPGHPFFTELIAKLETSHRRWQPIILIRHLRVMMTTGPLFVTRIYQKSRHKTELTLLSPDHYSSQDQATAYVRHIPGDTWAKWDTHLLNAIFRHWQSMVWALSGLAALGLAFSP